MRGVRSAIAISVVIGLGAAWWVDRVAFAEHALGPEAPEAAPLSRDEAQYLNALLDQIMENDQQIAGRCDTLMAELQIVKIRASMKRSTDDD